MSDPNKERELEAKEGGANGVLGEAAGIGAGGILGSILGAGLGGPVGMLVGGTVGTAIGAAIGFGIDYDSHEAAFRQHHEAAHPGGRHTFEQASPAYRYGWEARDRPDLRDQAYDKAAPALHRGWTGSGDFADYEGYVKQGWESRAASKDAGPSSPAEKG